VDPETLADSNSKCLIKLSSSSDRFIVNLKWKVLIRFEQIKKVFKRNRPFTPDEPAYKRLNTATASSLKPQPGNGDANNTVFIQACSQKKEEKVRDFRLVEFVEKMKKVCPQAQFSELPPPNSHGSSLRAVHVLALALSGLIRNALGESETPAEKAARGNLTANQHVGTGELSIFSGVEEGKDVPILSDSENDDKYNVDYFTYIYFY